MDKNLLERIKKLENSYQELYHAFVNYEEIMDVLRHHADRLSNLERKSKE